MNIFSQNLKLKFFHYCILKQARLRLAEEVEKEDVREAMRLMEMSKDSLNHQETRTTR